jgi:hypothetical protein
MSSRIERWKREVVRNRPPQRLERHLRDRSAVEADRPAVEAHL